MAVRIYCDNPIELLEAIRIAMDAGRITTWEYDKHGYFLHTPAQWKYLAWLKPRVLEDQLLLTILPPRRKAVSRSVYAVYHGRFIEMMLAHFDRRFKQAVATALPISLDRVRSKDDSDE